MGKGNFLIFYLAKIREKVGTKQLNSIKTNKYANRIKQYKNSRIDSG